MKKKTGMVEYKLLKPLNNGGVLKLPGEKVEVERGSGVDVFLLENGIVEVVKVSGSVEQKTSGDGA